MAYSPPQLSKWEVVAKLKWIAAKRQVRIHDRCQGTMYALGYDLEDVLDILTTCDVAEIDKHEPDYDPTRTDYIVVLDIEIESDRIQPDRIYLKVALAVPELNFGTVIQFRLWGS